jgi:tetratricopeptide (TPR) repeat protein
MSRSPKLRPRPCALALLAALALNTGCTKLLKMAKSGPSTETAAVSHKLDLYVQCLNDVDSSLLNTYHEYMARVDRAKGPRKDHAPTSLFIRNEIEPCFDKLKQGIGAPPARVELDAGAQEYLAALQQLAPVFKQAAEYYRQADYKDDNYAKGQQLHAPLVAAYERFDKASDQFHAALDAEDVRFKERELAEIEQQQGRNLSYLARALMLRAKQLVKVGKNDPIDLAQYQPALDAYAQALDEGSNYFNAHRSELGDRVSCWQTVERAARDFLKEGKEKVRNARDNKKPQPGLYSGDRFIDEYNDLIMMSNNCRRML